MWHEARKQEKKVRGMIVDYKRRAERRREFYEKIRRDPAQFLQIHGSSAKIHMDSSISTAAESCLMPWRGDEKNMIDRFDVRAHLDTIDTIEPGIATSSTSVKNDVGNDLASERQINYERWRTLVQNEFLGIPESKCLYQIWLEERFGMNQPSMIESPTQQNAMLKKKLAEKKAKIGYNYDKPEESSNQVTKSTNESSSSEEESDSDEDFDTTVNLETLTNEQMARLNSVGVKFGLIDNDFVSFAEEDLAEAERIRLAKELENEKSMFSGRKSRRERRALKERRMLILRANNAEENVKPIASQITSVNDKDGAESSSESEPEIDEAKIEFITSFGGSSDEEPNQDDLNVKPKKDGKTKSVSKKKENKANKATAIKKVTPIEFGPSLPPEIEQKLLAKPVLTSLSNISPFRDTSPSPKRSPSIHNRSPDYSLRRTNPRLRSKSKSKSRSCSPVRSKNRSRSRDRNRNRRKIRSRSRSRSLSSKTRFYRQRSKSRDRRKYRKKSYSKSRSRSPSRSRYDYNKRRERGRYNHRRSSSSRSINRSHSRSVTRSSSRSPNRRRYRKLGRSHERSCSRSRNRHLKRSKREKSRSLSRGKRGKSKSRNKGRSRSRERIRGRGRSRSHSRSRSRSRNKRNQSREKIRTSRRESPIKVSSRKSSIDTVSKINSEECERSRSGSRKPEKDLSPSSFVTEQPITTSNELTLLNVELPPMPKEKAPSPAAMDISPLPETEENPDDTVAEPMATQNESSPYKIDTHDTNSEAIPSTTSINPPLKRYYRHDLADESSSGPELEEETEQASTSIDKLSPRAANNLNSNVSKAGNSIKALTDKLKKKTQALIERQYKLDKKAERAKMEKYGSDQDDKDCRRSHRRERYRRSDRHRRSRSHSRGRSRSRPRSRSRSISRSSSSSRGFTRSFSRSSSSSSY